MLCQLTLPNYYDIIRLSIFKFTGGFYMNRSIEEIKQEIIRAKKITTLIRVKYFSEYSVNEIRDWLEANGFDRHMLIEYCSSEIVFQVPGGILMQVRSSDNNKLGLWGGIRKNNEQPTPSAIRKFYEETGIAVTADDLMYIDSYRHMHKYANGDFAYFRTYRYALRKFNSVPEIKTGADSNGWKIISTPEELSLVLEHQRIFLNKFLREPNYQGEDY